MRCIYQNWDHVLQAAKGEAVKTPRKVPDLASSKRRRARIKEQRADANERQRALLKAIAESLWQAATNNASVTLPPNIVRLLARVLKDMERSAKRGPRNQLAVFHETMAAQFLWRRRHEKAAVAYRIVGNGWGVSKAAVEKAVRDHGAAAARLLAMLKEDDVIGAHLWCMRERYLELGAET